MTVLQDSSELVPSEYILAEVLTRVDDESLRKGLTKGFYMSQINLALEKLAINVYFQDMPPLDQPMPSNGRWPIPDNFFDICELYAWNGDCCTPAASQPIYYKRLFNNAPNGGGFTAMNKGNQQVQPDPFFQDAWNYTGTGNFLYANVQNGYLMFSSSCLTYANFRVIYRGMGGKIGDKPLIPRPLRTVVADLVALAAFEVLMVKNPKSVYGAMYDRAKEKLYNKATGSWYEAEMFTKRSSSWVKMNRTLMAGKWGNW